MGKDQNQQTGMAMPSATLVWCACLLYIRKWMYSGCRMRKKIHVDSPQKSAIKLVWIAYKTVIDRLDKKDDFFSPDSQHWSMDVLNE
ncbi:MAG: hypothetical protein NTX25_09255 [Proteobacteria bacterium]|nr:hypothetical protein [Pseudomonadota bacterium]